MKPRILITGVTGFVGSHLARYLIDHDIGSVFGFHRSNTDRHRILDIRESMERFTGDITDVRRVKQVVDEVTPDHVYHLAAVSHVPRSLEAPRRTYEVNFTGTLNLLEALRIKGNLCRVLLVGSSAEYGQTADEQQPLHENLPLRPQNPYGVSKAAMDMLGEQWSKQTGWPVIRTRSFPHTGPAQRSRFACSSFARQVAEVEAGERQALQVGNLDMARDFLDVRDVVRAYHKLINSPAGVYNVCSGKETSLGTIVDYLKASSDAEIPIQQVEKRVREDEISRIVGSNQKLCQETDWKAETPIEKTMEDLLDYWRKRIEND